MLRVSERINHRIITEVFPLTGGNPFLFFTVKGKDILSLDVLLPEGVKTLFIEEGNISHFLLKENRERRREKNAIASVLKSKIKRPPGS